MSGQFEIEQQLRKMDVAPKRGQFRIFPILRFDRESAAMQESQHFVGHPHELLLVHLLAVEIQVFGETVDTFDEPQVRTADKGHLTVEERRG